MNFANQTVIVTGATGNLGREVASAFATAGANLVLVGTTAEKLQALFGADTAQRLSVAADLREPPHAQRLVDAAQLRFNRIDVLCNIAGGFRMGEAVHETSDDTWDAMFDINVRTMLNAARAVVPVMIAQKRGKIVSVAAAAAQQGAAHMGAYSAAKAVVVRLTEAMAAELKGHGINVNCVLPTIIDTPENRKAMPDMSPGRMVAPADIASTIMYLASDAARALHGASVPVSAAG